MKYPFSNFVGFADRKTIDSVWNRFPKFTVTCEYDRVRGPRLWIELDSRNASSWAQELFHSSFRRHTCAFPLRSTIIFSLMLWLSYRFDPATEFPIGIYILSALVESSQKFLIFVVEWSFTLKVKRSVYGFAGAHLFDNNNGNKRNWYMWRFRDYSHRVCRYGPPLATLGSDVVCSDPWPLWS